MSRILFLFRPNGTVEIRPEGFGGNHCHKATAPYEACLGGEQSSTPTAEAAMEPSHEVAPEEQKERA